MTSSEDTFDMSDDVFEESDAQTVGKKALNVDELNDERTASPAGYPGYKPPKEALAMYALENDYFQENNERKPDDVDGWKSYTIEDNDFDESIVHKVSTIIETYVPNYDIEKSLWLLYKNIRFHFQTILLGDSGVGKTSFLVQYNTGEFRAGSFSATVGIALTVSRIICIVFSNCIIVNRKCLLICEVNEFVSSVWSGLVLKVNFFNAQLM